MNRSSPHYHPAYEKAIGHPTNEFGVADTPRQHEEEPAMTVEVVDEIFWWILILGFLYLVFVHE